MKADNTLRCSRVARLRDLVVVSIALAAGASVQAQAVRKCQVDGRIVFQSAPCGPDHHIAPPAAVAVPAPVVTPISTAADAGAAPKKRTLAELLRERDGADRPRAPLRETQHDGANVLRSRMGAV
jgi:hypothetical protein